VREPFPSYVIHGSLGSFHKSRADIQEVDLVANQKPNKPDWGVEPIAEQGLIHTEKDGICIREKIPTLAGNYADYYHAVGQAILQDKSMPVSSKDGIQVMQIIAAASASHQSRSVIPI
jgi:predicted dehydrogenase